jgi:hypothetical protein
MLPSPTANVNETRNSMLRGERTNATNAAMMTMREDVFMGGKMS